MAPAEAVPHVAERRKGRSSHGGRAAGRGVEYGRRRRSFPAAGALCGPSIDGGVPTPARSTPVRLERSTLSGPTTSSSPGAMRLVFADIHSQCLFIAGRRLKPVARAAACAELASCGGLCPRASRRPRMRPGHAEGARRLAPVRSGSRRSSSVPRQPLGERLRGVLQSRRCADEHLNGALRPGCSARVRSAWRARRRAPAAAGSTPGTRDSPGASRTPTWLYRVVEAPVPTWRAVTARFRPDDTW